MTNEVLYLLLNDYTDHEAVYLSEGISSDESALKENPKYVNKVVAPTLEPVKSIGGFRTIPDYSFDTMPDDYAALVLIGGFGWKTLDAEQVVPIVCKAIKSGKIIGAICNAASFMAKHGFLNAVKHTGNGLEQTVQLLWSLQKNCCCCLKTTLRNVSRCLISLTSKAFAHYSQIILIRNDSYEIIVTFDIYIAHCVMRSA